MVNQDQVHLQNVVQYISAGFSISINLFLTALIATKSPKQLGAYKYLMKTISIHEIGYSIIDVIVSPLFYSYGSTFLIIAITKNRFITPFVLNILNTTYCGFFAFSLAIFALHFIYRFLVASGNKLLLNNFNTWKFFLWLAGPVFYGSSWSFVTYFLVGPADHTLRYVRNNILEVLDLEERDFVYVGPYFYKKIGNNQHILHVRPFIGILIMQIYITLSLAIVSLFGIKCYLRINSLVSKSRSRSSSLLQTQLFYALVTQAMIPIILMHGPSGVMLAFAFLEWDIGSLSSIVSITISLYPAIDPLPSIFKIKYYRKGAMDWWKALRRL